MVSIPGNRNAGASVLHPVSLIDIYPTLIDLCGLPKNPNAVKSGIPLDGHSLRPFLENPAVGDGWTGPDFAISGLKGPKTGGTCFSLRSEQYRYTLTYSDEEELYDHFKDPNEWDNLSDDPEYADTKSRLRKQLLDFLHKTEYPEDFIDDKV
jgi:arylsulfatase A-like enzyme